MWNISVSWCSRESQWKISFSQQDYPNDCQLQSGNPFSIAFQIPSVIKKTQFIYCWKMKHLVRAEIKNDLTKWGERRQQGQELQSVQWETWWKTCLELCPLFLWLWSTLKELLWLNPWNFKPVGKSGRGLFFAQQSAKPSLIEKAISCQLPDSG